MSKEEFIAYILIGILGNTVVLGGIFKVSIYAFTRKVQEIAQAETVSLAKSIHENEVKTENKFDSIANKIEELKTQFLQHVVEDVKNFYEIDRKLQELQANITELLHNQVNELRDEIKRSV